MTKIAHTQRAHALLSASGASRWMACTPSAKLEEEYGEKKDSSFAAEGTLAHELSELYLRKDILFDISDADFENKLEEIMSNEFFSEDMLDYVNEYTTYCEARLIQAKEVNIFAEMQIEQKLDLTAYIPESFGTADCCILNDENLEIIDLKYGKGVPVYAAYNKQLMLYALGALQKYDSFYDIKCVTLTIVQPRINNISSFTIDVSELRDWAENELIPKAKLAFEGAGELTAGEHCRFCSVKNRCRKLYEHNLEIAKHEFKNPELLTDTEIVSVIQKAPSIIEWLNGVTAYALDKAVTENKQWPGYKVVEGRSNRAWVDEKSAATAIFARFPELAEDQVYTTKLNTITNIEKLVGKKRLESMLSDVIIKPQGKPTLVLENDKRPAIGIEQAKQDFKD